MDVTGKSRERYIMGEDDQKYILLNDRVGDNIERNILSFGLATKRVPIQVPKGEILVALPEETKPNDSLKVALTGVGRKSLRVECPTSELARVTHEEADLLLGISSASERHHIYHERNRLDAGKKIEEATKVYVKVKGLPKEVPGIVWYKGPLPTAIGTMFGVELTEHKGHGTNNGTFRNHRYFECPDDSAVFVSLDKLTLKDNLSEHKKSPSLPRSSSSANKIKNIVLGVLGSRVEKNGIKLDQKELLSNMAGHVDKKVVIFVGDVTARGTLRYLGTGERGIAVAGIEMDKRIGAGTGIFRGKQRFDCKKDHAIFVPLETVIPERDFDAISYCEQNDQEKLSQEEDTRKVEQTWRDEAAATSLVYDTSRTEVSTDQEDIKAEIQSGSDVTGNSLLPSGTAAIGGDPDGFLPGEVGATCSKAVDFLSQFVFEVGSIAEIPLSDGRSSRYGVIRWIGHLPKLNGKLVAGLELEEEQSAGSDGTFGGRRYFTCPAGRGFFVLLKDCRRDSRFYPESTDTTTNSKKESHRGAVQSGQKSQPSLSDAFDQDSAASFNDCAREGKSPTQQINEKQSDRDAEELDESFTIKGMDPTTTVENSTKRPPLSPDQRERYLSLGLEVQHLGEEYVREREDNITKERQIRDLERRLRELQEVSEFEKQESETRNSQNRNRILELETEVSLLRSEINDVRNSKETLLQEQVEQASRLQVLKTRNQNRIEELETEISRLTNEISNERSLNQSLEQEFLGRISRIESNMQEQRESSELEKQELEETNQQKELRIQQLQEELSNLREEVTEERNSSQTLRQELEQNRRRLNGLERYRQENGRLEDRLRLVERERGFLQQTLREVRSQSTEPDWAIERNEIQILERELGRGGWGWVQEGKFRGCTVAVKQIYTLILSSHNRRQFEREISIASRCRHPCLLQFIGATVDDGSPLLVMELMEPSLRKRLEQPAMGEAGLPQDEILVIATDTAKALNYLHLSQPSPIIHRDISSGNVLLWKQGSQWRAKVSDYGTANIVRQSMTRNPGAAVYSAPEATTSRQTPKIDVYSFGLLLCEMCLGELPDPEQKSLQIASVADDEIRDLIRNCTNEIPEERPTMEQILEELTRMSGH